MDPNQKAQSQKNVVPLQQSVQPNIAPEKPKRSFLLYAGIGVIVFLFLGTFGLGAYVISHRNQQAALVGRNDLARTERSQSEVAISPQVNKTIDVSSWKMLESPYCSLSMKYPSTWAATDNPAACSIQIVDSEKKYSFVLVGTLVKLQSDATDSAELSMAIARQQLGAGTTDTSVAGEKGYEQRTESQGNKQWQVFFGKGNVVFAIQANYSGSDAAAQEMMRAIITSLQLTGDPEKIIKPADYIDKLATGLSQVNNTKRRTDINVYLNGVLQYKAEHGGALPKAITTSAREISKDAADICSDIFPVYIGAIANDPLINKGASSTSCDKYATGYQIMKDADGKVTVFAPKAELGESISVSR